MKEEMESFYARPVKAAIGAYQAGQRKRLNAPPETAPKLAGAQDKPLSPAQEQLYRREKARLHGLAPLMAGAVNHAAAMQYALKLLPNKGA